MITYRAGAKHADGIPAVIRLLDAGAFASPTRSTLPLLDYWRDPEPRLAHLGAALGWPLLPSAELTFEFATPVGQGRGKASFTDLMITAPSHAVAIEAKYTEPRYETVQEWLGELPTANREAVLGGWVRDLEAATDCRLDRTALQGLPYQLIHRAASVCAIARPGRALVYQVFGEDAPAYYLDDLRQLRRALPAAAALAFYVLTVPIERLARGMALDSLPRAAEGRSETVRQALLEGPLFSFGEPRLQAVIR